MARANRHYLPDCVWHITHRCHKREFLLKFERDRKRYLYWLYQAKKRFGLSVLNYMITSNHVHLLLVDTSPRVISKSIQLIAGRTAQEYNIRKNRNGSFWEDRYHATVVDKDDYLAKCMVYIDLNMVRAGVVEHPSDYKTCGYNELQHPPKRYSIIDWIRLLELFKSCEQRSFQKTQQQWIEAALANKISERNPLWSEAVAVGRERFVEDLKNKLGRRAKGRNIIADKGVMSLRESVAPYNVLFTPKK